MPGHNGLFARQRPIALPYFEYVDILGFSRRRSYLFAIIQLAQAIVLGDLLLCPVSAYRKVRSLPASDPASMLAVPRYSESHAPRQR